MRRLRVAFTGFVLADLLMLLVAQGPIWDSPKTTSLSLNSSRSDVCDRVAIIDATSRTGYPVAFNVISQDPVADFKVVADVINFEYVLKCSFEKIEDKTYTVVIRANYTSGSSEFTDLTLNITFAKSEPDKDECAPAPCKNGGICIDLKDGYNCTCKPGFNGTNCEINIDECADDPCEHGGVCTDLINGYNCTCRPGFNGTHCEINKDDCAASPCENGGECIDLVDGYICTCKSGFTGTTCGINIDECATVPCKNGGECADLDNGYRCTCKQGFAGTTCETINPTGFCECHSDNYWDGKNCVEKASICSDSCDTTALVVIVVLLSIVVVTLVIYAVYLKLKMNRNSGQLGIGSEKTSVGTKSQEPKYVNVAYVGDENESNAKETEYQNPKNVNGEFVDDDTLPVMQSEIQAKHDDVGTQEINDLDKDYNGSNGGKDEGKTGIGESREEKGTE